MSVDSPNGPATPRPGRRDRRRSRRKPGGRPQEAHAAAPSVRPVLPPRSLLDPSKPADLPLTPAEAAELKQHLSFIAKHRKVLRVKVNAAENLLLNGDREPAERGVCMHLLGKVDRACVNAALARLEEGEARTRLLGGIVRFTRDVGVVIQYLEALGASASRAEAAVTLTAALRQIDFASVSAAQMRRLLDLVVRLLPAEDRPHLVLSLLGSPTFRAAFDDAAAVLPAELAALFVPMRAAAGALFADEAKTADPEALARGVSLLLTAPAGPLRGLSEKARTRLLEAAVELEEHSGTTAAATAALLDTLPKDGRTFSRLATRQARALLQAHQDEPARALLEQVCVHHPDFKLPRRWVAALEAPRAGRVALVELEAGKPILPGLHRGLWLDRQRHVWALVGAPDEAVLFAAAAELHRGLALPGLLPLLASDTATGGAPLLALPQAGEPARRVLRRARHEPAAILEYARSGVEILAALALAGVVMPDAEPGRWLADEQGRLQLASLVGCRRDSAATATREHLELARRLCDDLLAGTVQDTRAARLLPRLAVAASLVELARLLVDHG